MSNNLLDIPVGHLTRRLVVVEDDPLTTALLSAHLKHARFVIRTASDVLSAKRIIATFDPDVVLIDVNLGPGPTGLDLAHYLAQRQPEVGIVILTHHPDSRSAGFFGDIPPHAAFMRKDMITEADVLTDAIEDVLRDKGGSHRHDLYEDRPLAELTVRQLDALRFAALGLSNAAIANERGITERAAEKLLQSALRALAIPDTKDTNRRVEGIRRYIAAVGLPVNPNSQTAHGSGRKSA